LLPKHLEDKKREAYKKWLASPNNEGVFVPFAISSGGQLSSCALNFLSKVKKRCDEMNIHLDLFFTMASITALVINVSYQISANYTNQLNAFVWKSQSIKVPKDFDVSYWTDNFCFYFTNYVKYVFKQILIMWYLVKKKKKIYYYYYYYYKI